MTTSLDVLLIETRRGAGSLAADHLHATGHRVHRCLPPTAPTYPQAELCIAVTGGTCPLEDGIDVAVIAGRAAGDHPGLSTAGVTCALRRHVPLVADDTCTVDLGPRLAGRAHGDVAGACERAVDDARASLGAELLARLAPTFLAHGLDPAAMGCRVETDGARLAVTITGPDADRDRQQALGVRALDAIRAADRAHAQVDVAYESTG